MQHLKVLVSWLKVCTAHASVECFAFCGLIDTIYVGTVKIIMDKISKRSKGYAFIEYTTEEAASAALKEMNGKVIRVHLLVHLLSHLLGR